MPQKLQIAFSQVYIFRRYPNFEELILMKYVTNVGENWQAGKTYSEPQKGSVIFNFRFGFEDIISYF